MTTLSAAIGIAAADVVFPTGGGRLVTSGDLWAWGAPIHWEILGFDIIIGSTGVGFRWDLLGFAFFVGLSVAIGQCVAMSQTLRRAALTYRFLWLWMPVTAIGVFSVILGYWYWIRAIYDFEESIIYLSWFVGLAGLRILPMVPGVIILTLSQAVLLFYFMKIRRKLVIRYLYNILIGIFLGFVVVSVALVSFLFLSWPIGGEAIGSPFNEFIITIIFFFAAISSRQGLVLESAIEQGQNQ